MSEEKVPKFLYHYTTIKTLPYMFQENGDVEFRFTDYRFLNDAEEGVFLKKFILKNKSAFRKSLKDQNLKRLFDLFAYRLTSFAENFIKKNYVTYIMSFTKCEDSMQFWRQDYAKDKGICLKLNTSKFKYPIEYEAASGEQKCPTFNQVHYISAKDSIGKVFPKLKKDLNHYLKSKGESQIDEVDFLRDFPSRIKIFSVKNKVWKSEDEWRLKIVRLNDGSTLSSVITHYEIDDLGIPRAKIKIKNPIEEIILGPSFTPQYVDSIKIWLADRGHKSIKVRCGDGVLND